MEDRDDQLRAGGRGKAAYLGTSTLIGRTAFVQHGDDRCTLPLRRSRRFKGYSWGRAGIGSRELARAILLDATGDEMLADRLCQRFTWEVVSRWSPDGFEVTGAAVLGWVRGCALPS